MRAFYWLRCPLTVVLDQLNALFHSQSLSLSSRTKFADQKISGQPLVQKHNPGHLLALGDVSLTLNMKGFQARTGDENNVAARVRALFQDMARARDTTDSAVWDTAANFRLATHEAIDCCLARRGEHI